MGKTFEALKRAEEERRLLSEKPVIASEPEILTISSQVTEQYSTLKQNILRNCLEKKTRVLLFSSSTKGEGNSTVLTHFALKLASGGEKVLLVDANLRDPALHNRFGVGRENGLVDLFLGKISLKEAIKKTRFPNLLIVTSGILDSRPLAADHEPYTPTIHFGSNSFDLDIMKMREEADWVFFDSPPINSFNDSIVLASKVEGVVMVVEAEKTRWQVVQKAKQRIEIGNGRILGVILNKRRFYVPEWLYNTL